MKITTRFLFASAVGLSLAGCYSMAVKTMTMGAPKSLYTVLTVTDQEVDNYANLLKSVDKKVVTDELGTYYHEATQGGNFFTFNLLNEDREALKYLLSKSVGFMEPIYVYRSDKSISPDWKATEKRYDYLTKKIGLKLLPLVETKKYHELIKTKPRGMLARLYDKEYYPVVLSKINGEFSYTIESGVRAGYYYWGIPFQNSNDQMIIHDNSANSYMMATMAMQSYKIFIRPVDYYKNLKSGFIDVSSGCSYFSPENVKTTIAFGKSGTDIPYVSGIYSAMKSNTGAQMSKAQVEFLDKLKKYEGIGSAAEEACLRGLRALDVSGAIESKRLK